MNSWVPSCEYLALSSDILLEKHSIRLSEMVTVGYFIPVSSGLSLCFLRLCTVEQLRLT
jgi:hypothetical protein